jgi:hypothetical protein
MMFAPMIASDIKTYWWHMFKRWKDRGFKRSVVKDLEANNDVVCTRLLTQRELNDLYTGP